MREIDIDQLATVIDGGAVVVDVRKTGEYAERHVPGARISGSSEPHEKRQTKAFEPLRAIKAPAPISVRCPGLAHDRNSSLAGGRLSIVRS